MSVADALTLKFPIGTWGLSGVSTLRDQIMGVNIVARAAAALQS